MSPTSYQAAPPRGRERYRSRPLAGVKRNAALVGPRFGVCYGRRGADAAPARFRPLRIEPIGSECLIGLAALRSVCVMGKKPSDEENGEKVLVKNRRAS